MLVIPIPEPALMEAVCAIARDMNVIKYPDIIASRNKDEKSGFGIIQIESIAGRKLVAVARGVKCAYFVFTQFSWCPNPIRV